MKISHCYLFQAAAQKRMDHIAQNRAWSNQGNNNNQIQKALGTKSLKHLHLSTAFDLKNPHSIGGANHLKDFWVIESQLVEVDLCKFRRFSHCGKHPQT